MCKIPSLLQQPSVMSAVENMVNEELTERSHDYLVAYNDSKKDPQNCDARRKKVRCNRKLREKLDELKVAYSH